MKTLRYDMIRAHKYVSSEHPQKVLKDLNIKYKSCEPVPVADCWLFYDCEYNCELSAFIEDIAIKKER